MPLAAYFRIVGAALLALLWIVDSYLPRAPAVQGTAADPPVIRLHSDRKWPERVVFDTSAPTVSVDLAALQGHVAASPAPDAPASSAVAPAMRDALAMLPADPRRVEAVQQNTRQMKQKVAARSARRHVRPQFVLASPRQFAWFGFRPW